MHHPILVAVFVAAAFWAALPVKLIAIGGTAYVLVAALKQIFPTLGGWQSLALNIALCVCGNLAVAKPGDLETPAWWAQLMLSIASASGIHGTVKGLTTPNYAPLPDPVSVPPSTNSTSGAAATKATMLLFAVMLCGGMMTGCMHNATPTNPATLAAGAVDALDANANQTLQTIHGFLASISSDVQSGKVTLSATQRQVIDTTNKAANAADLAEQAYHNSGGGSPAALSAALAAAESAFASAQTSLAAGVTK